jgi:hypothetical protein
LISEISPFDQEPCHGHIQALLSFLLIHLRGAEGEDICDTSCSLEAAPIRWCRLGQRFCPKALASRYMLGRYAFSLPDRIARGELRPQRNPRGGIGGPYLVKLFHCYSNPYPTPCPAMVRKAGLDRDFWRRFQRAMRNAPASLDLDQLEQIVRRLAPHKDRDW